jgi:hypothetical protein
MRPILYFFPSGPNIPDGDGYYLVEGAGTGVQIRAAGVLDQNPAPLYIGNMTGWDVLNNLINVVPPVAAVLLLVAAGLVFIIGFSRHGMNFIKYGFKQNAINDFLEKLATKEDIGRIDAKFDAHFAGIDTRIAVIETNHFGHLKDFLTELTSVLLDKGVINNQDKSRLDNQLRDM